MVDRLFLILLSAVRLAGTAVLVVGVFVVFAVLAMARRSRSGLHSLYAPVQDGHEGYNDRGAVSLVEMVVVTAMATVMLMAIASVAMVSERSAALAKSQFGASRRANVVMSAAMSSISDASPVYGCVLTDQGTQPSGPYSTPLSNCARYEAQTAAVAAFPSSTSGPQGICWYSYPSSDEGLVAPDLRCLVAYPNHTIWSFDWPPVYSTQGPPTYTSCDPSSCFGNTAPQPGSLPQETSTSLANVATFAGRTQAAQPFTFLAISSNGQIGTATSASSIYEVELQVVEDYGGAKAEDFSQSYTYKAYVGSATRGSEQPWQTI